ncbi:MAG: uracil-xanthine permease [Defluviitaleaceae bacterium]|nr:uracil-xanthine permease [Defluviitaleaceae bacterium]MCL2239508.1 uracil-xanthine permease [Defluviitaleaceae bacterium]
MKDAFSRWWDATSVAQTAHRGENAFSLIIKGLQSMLVMFGATIIVPLTLGMSPQITLFGMGIGTWIFLLLTKGKSPLTMGSSFAFMIGVLGVIDPVAGPLSHIYSHDERLQYALGGIIAAGAVYLIFSLIVKLIGADKFMRILPHAVTGPTVVLIGVTLAPHAVNQFATSWILGPLTLLIIIVVMVFGKGKIKAFPILIGLAGAYLVAVLMSVASTEGGAYYGLVNFAPIREADILGLPPFIPPRFALAPMLMLAPFALATVAENIADHVIVGAEMNEDLLRGKPGLSRTLFADGLQSMLVAAFGTPMNTTYSENVGLLIITKVFSSVVVAIGAGFAVLLGLSPAFAQVIHSIPVAIIGGASIMLYGMIASIGMRNVKEHVDLNIEKYLIIMSVMLVVGIGMRFGNIIRVEIADSVVRLDRMNLPIAILLGVILNAVLPNKYYGGKTGSTNG